MNQKYILLLAMLFSSIFISVSAQPTSNYSIKKVNEHVYIFTELWGGNNNGNLGVVIGDESVMLISSMMNKSAPALEA